MRKDVLISLLAITGAPVAALADADVVIDKTAWSRIEVRVVGVIRRQRRIRATRVLHQAFERWFRYIEYDHLPIGAVEEILPSSRY